MQDVRNKKFSMSKSENKGPSYALDKHKPWAADQVSELVVYVHLQAKESSVPFDFPRCPSADEYEEDNLRVTYKNQLMVTYQFSCYLETKHQLKPI